MARIIKIGECACYLCFGPTQYQLVSDFGYTINICPRCVYHSLDFETDEHGYLHRIERIAVTN